MPTHDAPGAVLVVDDEEAQRTLSLLVLRRAGLEAREASNIAEALSVLEQEHISLILLDQKLGMDNGVDLLRQIRANPVTATLPVILVTAYSGMDNRVEGLEAGASDFLSKPVHHDELVARVRAHLRARRTWLDTLERELEERMAVIRSLGDLPAQREVRDMAVVVCRELARHPHVTAVGIFGISTAGAIAPLGAAGFEPGVIIGRPLPVPIARALVDRCASGPWLERPGDDASPLRALLPPGTTLACVPLQSDEEPVGLLVRAMRSTADQGAMRAMRHLAATIDLADTVGGLLTPGLGRLGEREASRAQLEQILRMSGFDTVYQPVVNLADEHIAGYEALTRFDDGISPLIRFAEAGRLGMGQMLEAATLRLALEHAHDLPRGVWLSVNVSPGLLTDGRLPEIIIDVDRHVVLELTEHDPVDDYDLLLRAVGALGPGVTLSVDDAGSGFSSLRHVLALRPGFVKFDRSWIQGIDADPARQALVAGLGHFARQTGCRLIAEGIETEAELSTLKGLRVELGQGFLFGQPGPLARRDELAAPNLA